MKLGVGIDIGTAFMVSARETDKGKINIQKLRDAFICMEETDDTVSILESLGVSYLSHAGSLYVIGDSAFDIGIALPGQQIRRPMKSGVISPKDPDAGLIFNTLISALLKTPSEEGETCVYTVPAKPIGVEEDTDSAFSTQYHSSKIETIIRGLGFTPSPVNEAACIAYDQLRKDLLTGISVSFGAGMVNVCHMVKGVISNTFSILGSGDYVDNQVANSQYKITASRVANIKEKGYKDSNGEHKTIHVLRDVDNENQIVQGICLLYRSVVKNIVDNLVAQFDSTSFSEPVPIVLAGGTTLIEGFKDLFIKELSAAKHLPFEYSEVRHAEDPLFSVARGAMYRAQLLEAKRTKQ